MAAADLVQSRRLLVDIDLEFGSAAPLAKLGLTKVEQHNFYFDAPATTVCFSRRESAALWLENACRFGHCGCSPRRCERERQAPCRISPGRTSVEASTSLHRFTQTDGA